MPKQKPNQNEYQDIINRLNQLRTLCKQNKEANLFSQKTLEKADLNGILEDTLKSLMFEAPPPTVLADLYKLEQKLTEKIPPKILDYNILIATWNLWNFSRYTTKWQSSGKDSPSRDIHSYYIIAEIISKFDVVAIQEVKGNLSALKKILEILGPDWGVILTDKTKGDPGNKERMAYLYDVRKVQPNGLACEIVLPDKYLKEAGKQFARTPYAVGFRCGNKTFTLVSLHVTWGKKWKERIFELKSIAKWMADWVQDKDAWDTNIIAVGDFNIDNKKLYEAFTSSGLCVPNELLDAPRTISERGKKRKSRFKGKFDQIAYFPKEGQITPLDFSYRNGGTFAFDTVVFSSRKREKEKLRYYISDHYPLWSEFLFT